MSGEFSRYMVEVEISNSLRVARLSDSEFRCLITGVWPLAAKSPIRGCLLVGDLAAGPRDVAYQARCAETVARRTLAKLREVGMLEHDDELGCERCRDWDKINPAPKRDTTAAERQQRRRDKLAASRRDAGVTNRDSHADVTPPKLEVEGEVVDIAMGRSGTASTPPKKAFWGRP